MLADYSHGNATKIRLLEEAKETSKSADDPAARTQAHATIGQLKAEIQSDKVTAAANPRPRSALEIENIDAEGLPGLDFLLDMVVKQDLSQVQNKVFIVRSPPTFGNPGLTTTAGDLHHDFTDFNKILLHLRQVTEDHVLNNHMLRG